MRNTFESAVGDLSHCLLKAQPPSDKIRLSSLFFAVGMP